MSECTKKNQRNWLTAVAISVAVTFLYGTVLAKLGSDWWSDENYSHGLLVPFVIGMIIWNRWNVFKGITNEPSPIAGGILVIFALILLFAGTLGAELFTTRLSLVFLLVGIVLYVLGAKIFNLLIVPFVLLLIAIPIPQIAFNRIAFPLQIWASQMAVRGISLFDVPTLRKGNVIDILPQGSTQTISLEVVEACSGIRSLMTLVTLALILGYFTRRSERGDFAGLAASDLLRAVSLMVLAVPIAVVTNAARVTVTGILTYHYGKQATDGTWHEASGWLVYVVALIILTGANAALKRVIRWKRNGEFRDTFAGIAAGHSTSVLPLVIVMIAGGFAINYLVNRGETPVERKPVTELSQRLGDWQQRGSEIKFGEQTESVLRTSDYTMREYTSPNGRLANIYVGYYASQRSGTTYHSPQNCLPGAGWVMKDPQLIDVIGAGGKTFKANRYIIENGIYNEVMIYWYQGRGRFEASEYADKVNTVWDSITRSRSDGAIVRVMTSVGSDETASLKAASELSSRLAESLTPFVPE